MNVFYFFFFLEVEENPGHPKSLLESPDPVSKQRRNRGLSTYLICLINKFYLGAVGYKNRGWRPEAGTMIYLTWFREDSHAGPEKSDIMYG